MKKLFLISLLLVSVLILSGCSVSTNSNDLQGIHIPDTYNHTEGKSRILYSIKSTFFGQGEWASANGLLGTAILDVELDDRIGYESLFKGPLIASTSKMHSSDLIGSNLLMDTNEMPLNTKSIIARRESIIYTLAYQLEYRYIYNDMGNSQRTYSPQKNRKSNEKLKEVVLQGQKVYNEFLQKGFDDKTLRDSLCVGNASLQYDGMSENPDMYGLGSPQVCLDALKATVNLLNENKNDFFVSSYGFLYVLGEEMMRRKLTTEDVILIPNLEGDTKLQSIIQNTNEKEIESKLSAYITEKQAPILKIISDDLDNIKK